MKLRITITLLFAALLNSAHALPAYSGDLTVQPLAETVALIDPTDLTTTFTINGTAALSTGILSRDPVPGVCFLNIGLVEHFPRGGSNGGRRASVFVGALKDNSNNDIWWQWDSGESGYPNGRYTERRIDNYTIRIYDLIHRGDSLAFKWVHLDDNHPEEEWVDFDFNNVKWNDRDTDCSKGHCSTRDLRRKFWLNKGFLTVRSQIIDAKVLAKQAYVPEGLLEVYEGILKWEEPLGLSKWSQRSIRLVSENE
ncbi:hypothetical protein N0V87_008062 [Didymella glomerata]|uniref:Uncharacterized protein n=1 Tax=Didymella glomerata TaxID=749621 RepID=A0A9W8WUC3_9PLEO|nr:hypothetical protein N0V87_008062 [Didymella glomerata]